MKGIVRRTTWQAAALVLIAGVAAFVHARLAPPVVLTAPRALKASEITVEEAFSIFQTGEAVFIDARPREEFEPGHVTGAFWLPFESFASERPAVLDFIPPAQLLVIYCEGGDCHVSHQVADMLNGLGYTNFRIMSDGWPAWEKAGHPAESGPPPVEP